MIGVYIMVGMVVVGGVGNRNVVNGVMVVTDLVRMAIYCFRSAVVKCLLFNGGSGICGVVVEVGLMV